jgi:hypothetical protein
MSHSATETDSFDPTIPIPDILDTTYPATVASALASLTNRTRNLVNTVDSAEGITIGYSDVSAQFTGVSAPNPARYPNTGPNNPLGFAIKRIMSNLRMLRQYSYGCTESFSVKTVPVTPTAEGDGGGGYQTPGSDRLGAHIWNATGIGYSQLVDPGTAPELYWPIQGLPPTSSAVLIGATVKGAPAHSGLPATMPTLSLVSRQNGQTAFTVDASVTDTSASTGAYQTAHVVVLTNQLVTMSQNREYFFKFTGETGSNALVGLQVYSSYITLGA